ncbi:MAG: AI-2E family transporter [Chromatocurvus sp.]
MRGPRADLTVTQWVAALALLALMIALLMGLWRTHDIVLLVFLGIVFGIFLDTLTRGIRRLTHLSRPWALAAVLLLFIVGVAVSIAWFVPRIAPDIIHLSERLPQAIESLEDMLRDTEWGRFITGQLSAMQDGFGLTPETAQRFLGVFSTLVGGVAGAVIIFVLGIYFAAEPRVYARGILALIPQAGRLRGEQVLDELGHALRWWLGGRLLSMLAVFVLTWLGLEFLQVPLAFLLAAIAGLLSSIPNIGPIVSVVPALLIAVGEGDPRAALHVILLYIVVQILESYTITPFIQRKAVSLPPALLLIFQLLMGVLAGFIGLFAATPLLVVCMVLVKMLYVQDRLDGKVSLP